MSKPEPTEPLVPVSLWRRAQNPPGRRTPRGTYLLGGMVRVLAVGGACRVRSGTVRGSMCADMTDPARSTVRTGLLDAEVVDRFFKRLEAFHVRAVEDAEIATAREDSGRLTTEVECLAAIVPTHPVAVAAHQHALGETEQRLADAEDR